MGTLPTIAAYSLRHRLGRSYVAPDDTLSYTGNYLNMLWPRAEQEKEPSAAFEKALDVIFLLHADLEQNCSTNVMRSVGSALADPYSAIAAATAALSGPRHGGANRACWSSCGKLDPKTKFPNCCDA